ncbi:hypothetical protein Ciccas_010468 [Cichlidogyrus casuarinus]|uniref:IST1 homolog n=1 Tax=Cichlidogyrus casuarinus TaxID=1844966 RepID=A0ABD2PV63_9PLAT
MTNFPSDSCGSFARHRQDCIDPGLKEWLYSLVWAAPRIESHVPEMKSVLQLLQLKLGSDAQARSETEVNEKVKELLSNEKLAQSLIEHHLYDLPYAQKKHFQATMAYLVYILYRFLYSSHTIILPLFALLSFLLFHYLR